MKLTVYFFKGKDVLHIEDVLNNPELNKKELGGSEEKLYFYYKNSEDKEPAWKKDFFEGKLDNIKIYSKVASGVLLIKKEYGIFGIPFGYGHTLLSKELAQDDFGLKIVLNVINPAYIRKIKRRNISINPKDISEHLLDIGDLLNFGLDKEQDILEEIAGYVKDDFKKYVGEFVFGKKSFSFETNKLEDKITVKNIAFYVDKLYEFYNKEDYKEYFDFVDIIKSVNNMEDIEKLNNKLASLIEGMLNKYKDNENYLKNLKNNNIYFMCPAEFSDNVVGFSFYNSRNSKDSEKFFSYLKLEDFLKFLDFKKNYSINKENKNSLIDFIKKKKVYIKLEGSEEIDTVSIYKCLYVELKDKDVVYILSNGKWYIVDSNFNKQVNKVFEEIIKESKNINIPSSEGFSREEDYNKKFAEEKGGLLLDKVNVPYGGGASKIEICDVFVDGKIFHVKKGVSSSSLSHLFAQGRISGELLLESSFLESVKMYLNKLLTNKNGKERCCLDKDKLNNFYSFVETKIKEAEIYFVILSKGKTDIPFFSKVNLKSTYKFLKKLYKKVGLKFA